MASYAVNEDAVAFVRSRIDARQYVLDSEWGAVQPRADAENAYLEAHGWEEYARWHLGLPRAPRTAPRRATRSWSATSAACTAAG